MHGKLYEAGGYPGAVESEGSQDRVYGELYTIESKDVLLQLDDYEECSDNFPGPHEYIRKQLSISLPGGESAIAWVYLFNRDVSALEQIQSGNYVGHIEEKRNEVAKQPSDASQSSVK